MNKFNPYSAWLGLDGSVERPSYYQMFRLSPDASNLERIAFAADKAIAQVRSQRPGANAAEWSQLLDQLQKAKACLLDPAQRREYDQQLANSPRQETKLPETKQPVSQPNPNAYGPKPSQSGILQPSITSAAVATPAGAYPPTVHATPVTAEIIQPAQIGMPSQPAAPQQPIAPPSSHQPNMAAPAATGYAYPPAQQPANPYGSPAMQPMPPPNAGYAPNAGYSNAYGAGAGYPPTTPNPGYGSPPSYSPMAQNSAWPGQSPPPGPMSPASMNAGPMGYGSTPPGPMSPAGPNPYGGGGYGWNQPTPPPGPTMAPPIAQSNAMNPMAPASYAPAASPYQQPTAPYQPAQAYGSAPQAAYAAPAAVPYATPAPTAMPAQASPYAATAVAEAKPVGAAGVELGAPRKIRRSSSSSSMGPLIVVAFLGMIGAAVVVAGVLLLTKTEVAKQIAKQNNHTQPTPEPAKPTSPVIVEVPHETKKEPPKVVDPPPKVRPTSPEMKPKTPDDEMMEKPPVKPVTPEKPKPPEPPKSEGPTPAELAEMTKDAKTAIEALGEYNFQEANAALSKLTSLAKFPDHKAKVNRLKRTAELAQHFRKALEQTIKTLDAGSEIKLSSTTIISVVEVGPNKIVLRELGMNKAYTFNDLKIGVAIKLAEMSLPTGDADTRLAKGAYVFLDKRPNTSEVSRRDKIKKVEGYWKEAELMGADVIDLMKVLSDTYEFDKDAAKT